MIVEKQGGSPRADYGEGLINELSIQMTKDYRKGFDATNLRKMRQFYMLFPKRATVWRELSWSHYKLLIRIEDGNARNFYIKESIDGNWSVRQLEREMLNLATVYIGVSAGVSAAVLVGAIIVRFKGKGQLGTKIAYIILGANIFYILSAIFGFVNPKGEEPLE